MACLSQQVLSVVVERAWILVPKGSLIQQLLTKCQIQGQIAVPLVMNIDGLILALLGLPSFVWAFFICGEWGLLFVVLQGLLIVVASLVEHKLSAHGLQ